MVILVDAYNLLKQILHVQFIQDAQRAAFIKEFQKYALKRNNEVILVFDGGHGLYEYEEHSAHIEVIYSGQMHSADDFIKKYVKKHQGQNILLVSSDRELRMYAKKYSIESIASPEFYEIMQDVMEYVDKQDKKIQKTAYKTTQQKNLEVDLLMEQGSKNLVAKQIEENYIPLRVRNSHKKSKKDKKLLRKILKI